MANVFRKRLLIAMAIIGMLTFSNNAFAGTGSVDFGVDENFAPLSYSINEIPAGFDIDLMQKIFEPKDYELHFILGKPWDELYNLTKNSELDICGTLVKTPQREMDMLFTDAAYTRLYGVFTKADRGELDFHNLELYRIGVLKGYYSEIIAKEIIKSDNYEVFNNYEDMLNALNDKRIEALVEATEVVKYYIHKNNLIDQIVLQQDGISESDVLFGVAKDRPDLVEYINRRLKEIRSTGEYEIIYVKNFSSHSKFYYDSQRNTYVKAIIAAIIFILLTLLATRIYVKFLRRRINKEQGFSKTIADNATAMICLWRPDGRMISFNKFAVDLTGYSEEEVLERKWEQALFNDSNSDDKNQLLKTLRTPTKEESINIKVLAKDGKIITLQWYCRILNQDKRKDKIIMSFGTDISEVSESEAKFRLITENTSDVISVYNCTEEKLVYMSPSIINLTGFTVEEAVNQKTEEALTPESVDAYKKSMANAMKDFSENPKSTKSYIHEYQQYCKNGEMIWVELSTKFSYNTDGDIESLGVIRNIDERKKAQEHVLRLSYYDHLTGLYNRRFYEEELKRLDTKRNLPITLIMIDVNGLKLTNDAFGHQAGDLLLKKIAQILKKECRADEIVSRIGGDEFVILLPKTELKDAGGLIGRINESIATEKMDSNILSVSIGLAAKEKASQSMEEIFKEAEDDMYRHKLAESSSMRSKTIDLIMNSLYEKNSREMHHSKRVGDLCIAIATAMDFDKNDANQIGTAGLMHDIGKIGISDATLNKAGKLNRDEWHEIMRHSEIGYRILSSVNEFSEIAEYVLSHHERWDGKGYPNGLAGDEIPMESRIICLADAYDAMTSIRSYGIALSEEEAIEEIRKCSGGQFDPEIVAKFISSILMGGNN